MGVDYDPQRANAEASDEAGEPCLPVQVLPSKGAKHEGRDDQAGENQQRAFLWCGPTIGHEVKMTENSGHFKKGQSGNPGGRPKAVAEVQELARQYTAKAIERLDEIASNKKMPAQARVAANIALLDRAWGKPGQTVEIDDNRESNIARLPEATTAEAWLVQAKALTLVK